MMFQSISTLISHYYNVPEDKVTWLAQLSLVSMCVTLIPATLLSKGRIKKFYVSFMDDFLDLVLCCEFL